jgi:hypothetical protein
LIHGSGTYPSVPQLVPGRLALEVVWPELGGLLRAHVAEATLGVRALHVGDIELRLRGQVEEVNGLYMSRSAFILRLWRRSFWDTVEGLLTAFMYALTVSSGRPWFVSFTKPWLRKLSTICRADSCFCFSVPLVKREKSSVGRSMVVSRVGGAAAVGVAKKDQR